MTYKLLFLVEFWQSFCRGKNSVRHLFAPTCFTILLHIYHQTLAGKKKTNPARIVSSLPLMFLSSRGGLNIWPCLSPNSGWWGWRWDCLGGRIIPLVLRLRLIDSWLTRTWHQPPPASPFHELHELRWCFFFTWLVRFPFFSIVFHTSHIESWLKRMWKAFAQTFLNSWRLNFCLKTAGIALFVRIQTFFWKLWLEEERRGGRSLKAKFSNSSLPINTH